MKNRHDVTTRSLMRDLLLEPVRAPLLALALLLYGVLCATTVNAIGVVGEVTASWALATPPDAVVALAPRTPAREDVGPFEIARTRPMLALRVGDARVPLAVNAYTGALPDLPAWLARSVTGSVTAGRVTNLALGGLLLVLVHRFLRLHASSVAAGAATLVMASDWGFVTYRKVLGGTELALLAAQLLLVWALWSRRWRGGHHGSAALAIAVALGLHAKVTFLAPLAAMAIAAWATRKDRPTMLPPERLRPGVFLAWGVALLTPLALANLLATTTTLPVVPSHDTLALQLARLGQAFAGLRAPAREGWTNALVVIGDPRAALHEAWGTPPVAPLSFLRGLGLGLTLLGLLSAWRAYDGRAVREAPSPRDALLRFLGVLVPAEAALLLLANREAHHLGQLSLPMAMLAGLAAEQLAARWSAAASVRRRALVLVAIAPLVCAGVIQLVGTDPLVTHARARSFTEDGQAQLVDLLGRHADAPVLTTDYEVHGALEARGGGAPLVHAWPAIARGSHPETLLAAWYAGGGRRYLSVRASAPMIYDWSPADGDVARVTAAAGLQATKLDVLNDEEGRPWATLWALSPR